MLFQIGPRGKDLMFLEKCSGKGTPRLLSDVGVSFDHPAGADSWVEVM